MRHQLIAMLVLTSCATAHATALPPDIKATLLKGTNASCLETQVKDASNKAMTVEDIEKNKDALTPETLKKADEFSRQCAASTLKK
jgi:hypothetical protein